MSGILGAIEQYTAAAAAVARLHSRGCSHAAIKEAIRKRKEKRAAMIAQLEAARLRGEAAPDGQAVAWCNLTPSGQIAHFDGKPRVMVGPVGNEHHKSPLYTRPQAALSSAAAPAPVAGDADAMCPNCVTPWKCNGPHEESGAVAKLPALWRERMGAADHFNIKGSYTLRQNADELVAAFAQDRASQGGAAVPDGYALVPTHWNESLLASAGLLEATKCPIDALQAKALRKMADRLAAAPTPAAGVNVSVSRELLEQIYGMAREGCEAPSAAYRWCERIDEVFHDGEPSPEYTEYAQPLPDAALRTGGGTTGIPIHQQEHEARS